MNHLASITVLACCACVAGCMDDAAIAQRAGANKIKTTVAAAQKVLAGVSGIDPQTNRSNAEAIRQVAASATATPGSSPSQKAAMALIASQLQLQAAQLDAVAIAQLEQMQRMNADNIHLCASLNQQFQTLSKSADIGFPAEARDVLQKDHDQSAMTAKFLAGAAQKLKVLVDEAESAISKHNSNALVLEKQAGELKQKAVAAGAIAGLKLTVDSQKALTDSRKLLSEAATIELDTQKTELEQRMASTTADAYQASLNRNKVSMGAIAEIQTLRENSVTELKDTADKYRVAGIESATALRATSEKLNGLYDSAIESLDKAVTLAQQAKSGSGEMAKSAKSALLAAQLALASTAERRESISTIEISAYTAAAKLNEDGSWNKDAAAAQTIRNASVTKASDALEAALTEIPEVDGDANTNAAKFRKSVELAKANFAGLKSSGAPAAATDAVVEAPAEAPVTAPVETPVEVPVETPVEVPVETPVEAPVETPVEVPAVTAPVEAPVEAPAVTAPVEAPVEAPAETPVEVPAVTAPVEAPVEAPAENPVEVPAVTAPVEAPVEAPAENPVEVPSVTAPVEAPVEAPAENPVEAPQAEPTEAPKDIPAETNPAHTPEVKPISEPATDTPKSAPLNDPIADPTVPLSDPTADPTVPSSDPTADPTVPLSDPTADPTVPLSDPTADPTVPLTDPTEPATDPDAPAADPTADPTADPSATDPAAPPENP